MGVYGGKGGGWVKGAGIMWVVLGMGGVGGVGNGEARNAPGLYGVDESAVASGEDGVRLWGQGCRLGGWSGMRWGMR